MYFKFYFRELILLIIFLLFGFFLAIYSENIKAIRNFFYYLFFPIQKNASLVINSPDSAFASLKNLVFLLERNKKLELENKKNVFFRQQYFGLLEENEKLRKMLDFKKKSNYKLIPSKIIYREMTTLSQSATIDKGEMDGISLNMPVIAVSDRNSGLVGRIIEVYPKTSKILLISDNISYVSARIKNTDSEGIIEGKNINCLTLKYVLPESKIKIGDIVETSGIGGVFPEWIEIGTIKELKREGVFLEAKVEPTINLGGISEVFCILR